MKDEDIFDVVILGAGAAGLSAARLLAANGRSVCIVEARDRIGGRIHTIKGEGFSAPVEAGAEFIHGELPLTKGLMKEAGVTYRPGSGASWSVVDNTLSQDSIFEDGWDVLMERLEQLQDDMTIGTFLEKYFSEPKYSSLRESVKGFVQGYDAADIDKASAFALREEWSSGDVKGFRPMGGYSQLLEFLLTQVQLNKGILKVSTVANKIAWKQDRAEIHCREKETLIARKVLITVPVSVLKKGDIKFEPALPRHEKALAGIEVGDVIKFLFEFKERFWEDQQRRDFRQMNDLNFLFSDAFVPTWWTQKPSEIPLLTGWLAGPVVRTLKKDDAALLGDALKSLAYLFDCSDGRLEQWIRIAKVFNWAADPYSQGGYAYKTLETNSAIKIFSEPVGNTVYFAGEALNSGPNMGTVEAALESGKTIAEKMLR